MSAGDSFWRTPEMESFHTRFSAWTPFNNKSLNRQLFQERVTLISHWFDLWTNKQRQEFLFEIFLRCTKSQLRFVQDWFSERKQVAKVDFSTVLPRFISLYIFSFLSPKDLCAAAQVSWAWKFLTEQDCLWMPKCIKFGWFLPYTPTDNEYGAWKRHYIACVSHLDWLTPREAAATYGTLNESKTEDEELLERHREKCLRKRIWEKIALRRKELFKVRPPWVSGMGRSSMPKPKCQPRLSQTLRERAGSHEALEKQLVLTSLETLPKQSNISGSHSYPLLSKKNWHGVYKNDDSSSCALRPHFILISSRIPAYEMVVESVKAGVVSVVYEHSVTLESLLYLIEKALDGQKAQSMGIFSDGDSREINLLQGYKIGVKNLLKPEVRDFWEKLGSYVATEKEGGHVDFFAPLGASEAGTEVLSQLSQLTGTFFTAPTGIATGSYQHIFSDWLGAQWGKAPSSIYFSESKLQTWSSFTDFLEDTLKGVRKQLCPLFKELQKSISGRMIGQFMFDTMGMSNFLNNQEIAQALADGLMELSKEDSDKPLEFLSYFLLKKCGKKIKDFEGNVIPTKCDPKTAFGLLMKERNGVEDNSWDTKSRLSKNDLNFEALINLERMLQKDSAEKRTRVVRELLQSERKYVQMLEIVRDVYVTPLKAALSSNRAILSAANIQILFSDILQILSLNRQFLDNLRDRLQEWGPAHCVGEIVTKFGSQLNTYTNFFNNYPVILKTIEKCREMIPAFRTFLKRHDKTIATKMLSLPELLLYPSRRFEEYLNLLYAVRLHTPAEHVDRGDLTTAIDQIKKYKDYIDQMKQNINMKDHLSDIQRIVWGCPTLSEVNRYLIRVQDVAQLHCCDEEISFSLRLYEHIRDLSLFLFNDALLISSRGTSHTPFERTSKTTYQFIASVALHRLLIENIPDSKYVKNAFILQGPKYKWICATEAEDDKFLWLSVLQNAIKSRMEK
ncbi:epithelial cell-transforming sequence 2 oncogene-like isoform X1 [Sapajus apella]|uniref:Epithelial cell-transforming sequence 2 oncogene-like isoform X1 n=2 Tax=Sapajus apella TaxID=9515 RepID=A0A6J3HKK1_SAPAP|nr:epithelial cell-transforming sequence 2 oncogene-like isoform X1 [Sapajus apella]XP_032130517.1 epithelial cell-transforming sequence 2 oncogene-like isoform X1 [Sapajus apella]XP_032130518.1 epithelial cell-transforming sequence 2 oncogene-like isoform X1 [Sapajus apella]